MVYSPFNLIRLFFVCDKSYFNFCAISERLQISAKYTPLWQFLELAYDNMADK